MINHSVWVGHKICLGICIIWKEINVQCLMFNVQLKSIKPLQPRLSSQFDTWITGSLDALMTNNQNNHQLLTFRQNCTLHSPTCKLQPHTTWKNFDMKQKSNREKIWDLTNIKDQRMDWSSFIVNLVCSAALLLQLIIVVIDQQLHPTLTNTR